MPTTPHPAGQAPFLVPGEVAWWHYRRPGWQEGEPETVHPVRVVRDDEAGLVAWLAGGTPVLAPSLPDGRHPRSLPLAQLFLAPRIQSRMLWKGTGTLRIAPTGAPWSVWLFWTDDGADGGGWTFDGYYVNLESPHERVGRHTLSQDHVLDVLVSPDLGCTLKDEPELAAAVAQGRLGAEEAHGIRRDAAAVVAAVAAGGAPFAVDDPWRSWRPDPTWETPGLPPELAVTTAPVPRSAPRTLRPEDSRY